MNTVAEAEKRSIHFLENEKQFHLGMLPTEQPNPKTKGLDKAFEKSVQSGVEMLLSVDEDIVTMAEKMFRGKEFALMLESSYNTMMNGGKIIFSGCGATGRLSILMESMWRTFFRDLEQTNPQAFKKVAQFEDRVFSIMTGGDYALIKSVESFEDYPQFGQRQAQELNLNSKDVLVAVTEGGETSSVLGSVQEALDVKAKPFLLFNNPADILSAHIERSREAIENPDVTVLDLFCGSMALAGSTRMQATSSEQLVCGALLERLLNKILKENLTEQEFAAFPDSDIDYALEMKKVVANLKSSESVDAIAEYINFEKEIYEKEGRVTYFADKYLIDIFTDTTERSPTFMLAPFRKHDDLELIPSFAFVKTPLFSTPKAWEHYLGRKLRCLAWTEEDYIQMKSPEEIVKNPPSISEPEMLKFLIGNEDESCRYEVNNSSAVSIFSGNECNSETIAKTMEQAAKYAHNKILIVGDTENAPEDALLIKGEVRNTLLKLMDHMKIKLALNTISTGTMVCLGRVKCNWMSFVSISNKKLVDRSIRLISELGKIPYEEACLELHKSVVELETMDFTGKEAPSPVQYTLKKLTA